MQKNNKDIKSVSIRIPYKLLQELHYVADYEGRSANSQILYLIRENIEKFKATHSEVDVEL